MFSKNTLPNLVPRFLGVSFVATIRNVPFEVDTSTMSAKGRDFLARCALRELRLLCNFQHANAPHTLTCVMMGLQSLWLLTRLEPSPR